MKRFALTRVAVVAGILPGIVYLVACFTARLLAQAPGAAGTASQGSVTAGQATTSVSQPARVGPRRLSEAEAYLQQGTLTLWVPHTYYRGMRSLPAEERYHDYDWEGLRREFKADFPNFKLRFVELDLAEFIRAMHLYLENPQPIDVAFIDNYGELGPLLKHNAVIQMWGSSRLQYRGWWVVFREARNFAAGESFLLWASQRFHWTPWSVSTHTIDAAGVSAAQQISQEVVQDYVRTGALSPGAIVDSDAALFAALGKDRAQTLLSVEPLLTFGNSRLALVLLTAVGEGDQKFGIGHFGVMLRNTEAGWKVWHFLPDYPLPDLVRLFQSIDGLGLEEAAAQAPTKIALLAPPDNAELPHSPQPEIEWSTVDAPVATYVVESQFTIKSGRKTAWAPSKVDLISPISVGPSIRIPAPFGGGDDPHRWRVWAISKSGAITASEWRIINFNPEPRAVAPEFSPPRAPFSPTTAGPTPGATSDAGRKAAETAVAVVDPPCMEWVEAAERGQPMIPPHIGIRYNLHAPSARLASAQSLSLVIASRRGIGFDSRKIPMTRAAGDTWQSEFTPEKNYIPGYAIFFFEDERNTIDNHGGQYWDILNCSRGEPDPFSVTARASTYEGWLLAPGIQRAPNLAKALEIVEDDLKRYPNHASHDDYMIWTYELKLGAESPSAYEQVGREVDAFITAHGDEFYAMRQLAAFIGPHQQKLPSNVVQRFRQAVAALPGRAGTEEAAQINSELDYWLPSSELDLTKRVQDYLAFAVKYPQSLYAARAYQDAFYCGIELKDVAGAESVFEKLVAMDRENAEVLLTMAQLYIDEKTELDHAVNLLNTADAILTKNHAHYAPDLFSRERGRTKYLRGRAYVLLGDLPHARADLEAAAQAMPDDAKVFHALGEVREGMGEAIPALDAYLTAASAPYQESSSPCDAYERLFVAQKLGTSQDAEQKILEQISANTLRAAAAYTPIPFNRPAPKFSFTDLAGKTFDNQTAQGKPALLTFWTLG